MQARIPRLVIGAMNRKAGCCGSILNITEEPRFNHQVQVERGVLEEESARLLSSFFQRLRLAKEQGVKPGETE